MLHRYNKRSTHRLFVAVILFYITATSVHASSAAETLGVSGPSPAVAKAVLKKILARSEYRPSPYEAWMMKALLAVQNVLARIFGSVSPHTLKIGAWVFVILGGLAFATLIFFLILNLIRQDSKRDRTIRKSETRPSEKAKRPTIESLLAQAEDAAEEGRYRDAFRAVYLATLFRLDRKGFITYTESGTNWEYMRALTRQTGSDSAQVFRTLTTLFDESIYGHRELSESDVHSSMDAHRRLEEMA